MKGVERLFTILKRDGLVATIVAMPVVLKRRIAYQNMFKKKSSKQRFSAIYEKKFWSMGESGSGEGSEIEYTERLRNWLVDAIPKYGVRKLVDAPCGDFNWMRLVVPKLGIEYFGFDIVDGVIDENRNKYADDKTHFAVADICEDELPSCDLLMVRDCLFHLSFKDINRFLENIAEVDYKYLLTTTHIVEKEFRNSDITTGAFRLIDLFTAPFNFKEKDILERVDDYPISYAIPREMILIAKAAVPKELTHDVQQ